MNPGAIWELDNNLITCTPQKPRVATISITVTDTESGVASVKASWTIGGGATVSMTPSGNTYSANFGPFVYPTVPDNTDEPTPVGIIITAVDAAGNDSKTTTSVLVNSLASCFL